MKFATLFITFLLVFSSCSEEKKDIKKQPVKTLKTKKKVKKVIQKRWDTINRKNAREFLIAFGERNKETKVKISTKFGDIKLKLYNDTPMHRASFLFLAKSGYFNGTVFYRVVKNFVVQGGDSEDPKKSKMRYKYGNYKLAPEYRKNHRHKYGALASARVYDYNPNELSTPFEFYIVQNRKGAHHLNGKHTVFGEVISGFSTINKIANVKTGPGEWPDEDILMQVEILD